MILAVELIGSQPRSGMIDLQESVEGTVQNLMAPQEFVSIRGEVRSVNERLAEHSGAPPATSMLYAFFT